MQQVLTSQNTAATAFGASAATARGVEDCVIKTLGRWESIAYLQYVCLPREQLAGIFSRLAAPLRPPTV